MPDQEPTAETDSPQKPKKGCRGCLARLGILILVLFALLIGALIWLNGPGFRWIAHKYGPNLLTKNGFEGDFQLSGTLLNGPQIDSINLTSESSPLKALTATNLQLRYHPLDLKDLRIEALTADALTIDLDLSQSSPKTEKEEKPPSENSLSDLLAKYRPLATHPKIEIGELNLHVHQGEQNFYRLQQASLQHQAQSDTFELKPGTVTDFENQAFQPATARIIWNKENFTLSQLPLSKELSVPNLVLKVDPLFAEGKIAAYGSTLDLSTDLRSEVTAQLGPEALDLAPFFAMAPAVENATGKLTQLKATASLLDQEFSQWAIDLSLTLDGNSYQKRAIPETKLTVLKEGLELETTLNFNLPEQPQTLHLLTLFDPKSAQSPTTAWKNSTSDLTTELASLASFLQGVAPSLNLPAPPDGWPDGEALLLASLGIKNGEPAASNASLTFNELNWAEARLQKGELLVNYVDSQSDIKADLFIEQNANSTLKSRASFHPETQAYAATFSAENFDANSLQPFVRLSLGDVPLAGTITLNWQGNGALPDANSHRGKLSLAQTRLSIEKQTPIQLALDANYEGISRVEISRLEIQQDDQLLTSQAIWNGERISIPKLSLVKAGQQLVTGNLSAPFSLDTDFKNYFTLEESWQVDLKADGLNIPETADLLALPLPEGLQGTLNMEIDVAGTPAKPSLAGKVLLDRFTLEKVSQLPPINAGLAWATAGQTLTLNGTIKPDGRNAIVINGSSGFHPKKWAANPDNFLDESFNLRADAPNVRLEPFADLSPLIRKLEGNVVLQLNANGTFRTPNLTGSLNLDLPKARFNIERLRRVRQTKLKATFANNKVQISPFRTSIDGGLIDLSGSVDLADTSNPSFQLRLNAEKALVWRDDNINARTDAALFLTGSLQQARLSGELGIAESLFYKDIELLPLDVPVSIPKPPKLPSLAKKPAPAGQGRALPIPEPFASWTLDLRARTADPFLVRGNLTTGEVVGEITATGELADPRLAGELRIKDFDVALPFSTLTIDGGRAFFSPKGGFIPELDIRAQSRIPPYDVDIFVAGSATSPAVSFSSNPPLPESEVMTLLATGTTSAGLEDPDAAKGKAFQLLIEQIRRAPPGSPLHPLAKFAEPLKDVEIQVGGSDPFTGKRRNSVTVPIPDSERWHITASVDAESNTRGLVLYLLKFR